MEPAPRRLYCKALGHAIPHSEKKLRVLPGLFVDRDACPAVDCELKRISERTGRENMTAVLVVRASGRMLRPCCVQKKLHKAEPNRAMGECSSAQIEQQITGVIKYGRAF